MPWFSWGRSKQAIESPANESSTAQLMRRIRRVQIKTSHKVDDLLVGRWHSAFKGRGMEFEEVRPYQVGDDVRTIDWNVTARAGEPFVKLFREERETSVILLVDVSGSQNFGTQQQSKAELVTEFAATIAMSAIKNNDKVGLTMFSDKIEKSIPTRQGSRHALRIIRELLFWQDSHSNSGQAESAFNNRTDIQAALEHLGRTNKRRRVVFLISDFQNSGYEKTLRVTRRKHDVIPVVVGDQREFQWPSVGMIRLRDPESGGMVDIDTNSRSTRNQIQSIMRQQSEATDEMFRRMRLEPLRLMTGEDFVDPLAKYFQKRHAQA
ncbi:DUF58 domain-containing protein [Rubripirellula obstinata]|nr:DUF58 domain-containing protein [Rubripirellula obstinata]